MGNTPFSKEISGIPDDWDFEKISSEDNKNKILLLCEGIKNIPNQETLEKFVNIVKSNTNVSLSLLMKFGKVCSYLSPCASILICCIEENSTKMEDSLKSYCKSEIAKEISDFLTIILETHLKEIKRNIKYEKLSIASDHASTAISLVETIYEKNKLNEWFKSIEDKSGKYSLKLFFASSIYVSGCLSSSDTATSHLVPHSRTLKLYQSLVSNFMA
jgi:hypothetical protein